MRCVQFASETIIMQFAARVACKSKTEEQKQNLNEAESIFGVVS